MFGFNLGKCVFKTVNVSLWKSDKPVSIVWVCWNDLGKFVKMAEKCSALGASPQSHTVGLQLPHGSLQFSLREKYKFPFWTIPHISLRPSNGPVVSFKGGVYMENDISASRCNSAKRYIGFLHFLVRFHRPVYMKQMIHRLTDKSFWKGNISGSRYIVWPIYLLFSLI